MIKKKFLTRDKYNILNYYQLVLFEKLVVALTLPVFMFKNLLEDSVVIF